MYFSCTITSLFVWEGKAKEKSLFSFPLCFVSDFFFYDGLFWCMCKVCCLTINRTFILWVVLECLLVCFLSGKTSCRPTRGGDGARRAPGAVFTRATAQPPTGGWSKFAESSTVQYLLSARRGRQWVMGAARWRPRWRCLVRLRFEGRSLHQTWRSLKEDQRCSVMLDRNVQSPTLSRLRWKLTQSSRGQM